MTNNPTIDGVSREEFERSVVTLYGHADLRKRNDGCYINDQIQSAWWGWKERSALLDASASNLREHCKQCAEVVKTWPEWKQNCLVGAPVVERQPVCATCNGAHVVDDGELTHSSGGMPYENGPIKCVKDCPDCLGTPEVAALQSTIAQLQAEQQLLQSTVARYLDRIAELESGRGEPVAWLAEAVGPDGTSYRRTSSITQITMRDVEYAWGKGVVSKYEINIQPLFAAQQAPVAVVLPPFAENVISKLRRCEECFSDFESGGVDIGRHWLDLLTQLGLLNRVQRSPALWEITQQGEDCLDATAALNGERK